MLRGLVGLGAAAPLAANARSSRKKKPRPPKEKNCPGTPDINRRRRLIGVREYIGSPVCILERLFVLLVEAKRDSNATAKVKYPRLFLDSQRVAAP